MLHKVLRSQAILSNMQLRTFSAKVLVSNLPPDWNPHQISSRFSKSGPIEEVQLIKNRLGQSTGKAIVVFKKEAHAAQAVDLFNNFAVDDMVNLARPWLDKGEQPRRETSMLSKRVYLMNVPYDATVHEIEGLVKEFVPIDKVVVPRDPNGYARGYAFAFLKKASDVQTLIDFVDGRHIRSR